jgi:hypothetical protein
MYTYVYHYISLDLQQGPAYPARFSPDLLVQLVVDEIRRDLEQISVPRQRSERISVPQRRKTMTGIEIKPKKSIIGIEIQPKKTITNKNNFRSPSSPMKFNPKLKSGQHRVPREFKKGEKVEDQTRSSMGHQWVTQIFFAWSGAQRLNLRYRRHKQASPGGGDRVVRPGG